jgi:5-aminopentanamidase
MAVPDLSKVPESARKYPERRIRIAIAQIDVVPEDVEKTVTKVCDWIGRAASTGARVVLFPEFILSASYYALSSRGLAAKVAETIPGPSIERVAASAREYGIDVIVGIAERSPLGVPYDSSVYIDNRGNVLGTYRKTHIAEATEFAFASGSSFPIVSTDYGRVALLICYDLEFPETARLVTLKGAEIIFHMVANWSTIPFDFGDRLADFVFRSRAMENMIPIATCNRVGYDSDLQARLIGKSSLINAMGDIVSRGGDKEELIVGEIDLSEAYRVRDYIPYLKDRKPALYRELVRPMDDFSNV